jgi:spectinomycin phosphotransferase
VGIDSLLDRITNEFGVSVHSATPVHGGQDSSAKVWRGLLTDGSSVAIKATRRASRGVLLVQRYLGDCGVPGIVDPLLTRSGTPVAVIDDVQVSVQPWISGRRGAAGGLSDAQWRTFGELLAQVHAVRLPIELQAQVPTETYIPVAAESARHLQRYVSAGQDDAADDLIRAVIEAWRAASDRIAILLDTVEKLADESRGRSTPGVLCHGDAHIANVLVDEHQTLWLLDWDTLVIAPPERDLMFVIDGVLGDELVTAEQQSSFFQGYGAHDVDLALLAYYQCDWALQDLTDFAERVLHPEDWPDERRAEALRFFRSLLWPTGIVTLALDSLRQFRG